MPFRQIIGSVFIVDVVGVGAFLVRAAVQQVVGVGGSWDYPSVCLRTMKMEWRVNAV